MKDYELDAELMEEAEIDRVTKGMTEEEKQDYLEQQSEIENEKNYWNSLDGAKELYGDDLENISNP